MLEHNIFLIRIFMAINDSTYRAFFISTLAGLVFILYYILRIIDFKHNKADKLLTSVLLYSILIIPISFLIYYVVMIINYGSDSLPKYMDQEVFLPMFYISFLVMLVFKLRYIKLKSGLTNHERIKAIKHTLILIFIVILMVLFSVFLIMY